jgi:hypothetical protein
MKRARSIAYPSVCLVVAVLFSGSALRATPLHPAYDLQGPGLSIAVAGAGMAGPTGRLRILTVNVGGPVKLALLYWAGRDYPCPEDEPGSGRCVLPTVGIYKDQVLTLDGTPLTGIRTGNEVQPDVHAGPVNNIGYFADVTAAVRARGTGRLAFTVADGDRESNLAELDGAGLLVVYTDPAKTAMARVIIDHGLDFAYGEDFTPGDPRVTAAVTFEHGAAHASARRGELVLFAGGAESAAPYRPDRIDLTNNPSLLNVLRGSSGPAWDAQRIPVNLPIGAGATTAQIFSEPVAKNPDSLLWVLAALWVPLPVSTGCPADLWNGFSRDLWMQAGNRPEERVRDVFRESSPYGAVGVAMLSTAVRFRGGPGLLGAAKDLVQAGTAALLNAGHPKIEYPLTRTQVINRVDAALLSQDLATILDLARELEMANATSCPLD